MDPAHQPSEREEYGYATRWYQTSSTWLVLGIGVLIVSMGVAAHLNDQSQQRQDSEEQAVRRTRLEIKLDKLRGAGFLKLEQRGKRAVLHFDGDQELEITAARHGTRPPVVEVEGVVLPNAND